MAILFIQLRQIAERIGLNRAILECLGQGEASQDRLMGSEQQAIGTIRDFYLPVGLRRRDQQERLCMRALEGLDCLERLGIQTVCLLVVSCLGGG